MGVAHTVDTMVSKRKEMHGSELQVCMALEAKLPEAQAWFQNTKQTQASAIAWQPAG